MKTYITFYQGEIRAVEITIRDQDDDDFDPSGAYFSVVDSDGTTVKAEADCLVTENKIYALINTEVTATVDEYEIVWRIVKDSYTYYHKTKLNVEEL